MNEIFVDTGACLAIIDESDPLHTDARKIYQQIVRPGNLLVTTNMVISETYTLIQRRIGNETAIRFLDSMDNSPRLSRVYADFEIEHDAGMLLRQYKDQAFSYVDAVSFAVMKRRRIVDAFAFDHHFLIAGFVHIPSPQ